MQNIVSIVIVILLPFTYFCMDLFRLFTWYQIPHSTTPEVNELVYFWENTNGHFWSRFDCVVSDVSWKPLALNSDIWGDDLSIG